jgi:hypothetical protein
VEATDRFFGLGRARKLHEGEAARTPRCAVFREVDIENLPRRGEKLLELLLGCLELEVANEDFVSNGSAPFC